jgi:hypothetical protein
MIFATLLLLSFHTVYNYFSNSVSENLRFTMVYRCFRKITLEDKMKVDYVMLNDTDRGDPELLGEEAVCITANIHHKSHMRRNPRSPL